MLIADGVKACAATDSARLYIGYYNNIVMVRNRRSLKCRQMGSFIYISQKNTKNTNETTPKGEMPE